MLIKRSNIINKFNKGNIITKSEKFFDASEKNTESVTEEKFKKESDWPIPIWVKVPEEKFNLIKQIINENKDVGTAIDVKRYTLIDANGLVNKIAKKTIDKNKAINFYNNLVKKAKQISELRSTPSRQKMLEIFNYLEEIFNGPKKDDEQLGTTHMFDLKKWRICCTEKKSTRKRFKNANQMLSRLPISLAQLKAGNNSEKLKNEIRQILYSLHRSKKLQNKSIKV